MGFLAFSGLLNFVTSVGVGTFVFLQRSQSYKHVSFFALSLSIAVYSLGYFLWQFLPDKSMSAAWFYILFEGIIFINISYLFFVFSILDQVNKRRKEILFHLALGSVFTILNVTNQLYTGLEERHGLGFWPMPTSLFNVFLLVWFAQCFYGFFLLLNCLRIESGIAREQIKYFLIAAIFGFFGGATNWPMWFGVHFPPVFNIMISLYVGIVSYAIIRYRLMDIRVAISSAGIFFCVYALSLGGPIYLMARGHSWPALIIAIILASIAPIIYNRFRKQAEESLLKNEIAGHDALIGVSGLFSDKETVKEITHLFVESVTRILSISHAAIYLYDGKDYAKRDEREAEAFPDTLAGDSLIVKHLCMLGVVSIEELNHTGKVDGEFKDIPASVLVPLRFDKKLIGILFLGEKDNGAHYSDRDLAALKIVAVSTAQAINNADRMETKEKTWFEKAQDDRLRDLGIFSAKVAHQMGNRLHRIVGELGFYNDIMTDEFLAEVPEKLRQTLKKFVGRFEVLIKDAESAAMISAAIKRSSKSGATPMAVRLKDLVDGGRALAETKHPDFKYDFVEEYDPALEIWANDTVIQDVFSNAIDNSLDAMKAKQGWPKNLPGFRGQITVKACVDKSGVLVDLIDNGIGIKPEDQQYMFVPMWTTKGTDKGTGLGLSTMFNMVQSQNGTINLSSEHGIWTKLTITLPLVAEEHKENAEARR